MNNTIRKSCQLVNNALVTFDLLLRHCPVRTPAGSFNFTTLRYLSSSSHPSDSMSTSSGSGSAKSKSKSMTNVFTPKKALVLGKFSRYEFEKHRNPNLSEEEFIQSLERRGSDYKSLLYHHNIHVKSRDHIADCLKKRNIETKVINRFAYSEELINWADMVITSGGDGTYLMAASKITNSSKLLIGINSDPTRSVGYLCLPNQYSSHFDKVLDLMLNGQFEWQFRQRIRVTLEGENAFDDPTELHDQQLLHPEYRFLEIDQFPKPPSPNSKNTVAKKRALPFRALNEVFVGESLSSRVSYFELAVNGKERFKVKSSGMTICTGTGSTSWSFNINKLTPQCVQNLFNIVNSECFPTAAQLDAGDSQLIQKITDRFNNSLIFSPSQLSMAYTIRDPVVFGTNFQSKPRDFAKRISVKSRMTDAHIVIDGGLSFPFNDGARAIFDIHEEDALRTIKLKA